jgi:hypothetical protein
VDGREGLLLLLVLGLGVVALCFITGLGVIVLRGL